MNEVIEIHQKLNDYSTIIKVDKSVKNFAVDDTSCCMNCKCDLYDNEQGCKPCIIGMVACEQLIGIDGIFKESNKKFEVRK